MAQTKGAISNKEMDLFMSPCRHQLTAGRRGVWIDVDQTTPDRPFVTFVAASPQANRRRTRHRQHRSTSSDSTPQQGGNFADADAIVEHQLRQDNMATDRAPAYDDWLVQNQDKLGTQQFATRRQRLQTTPPTVNDNSSRAQTVLSLTA